jgi:hypothetical protein
LKQNNIFKAREGKYQTKINALETLVAGTTKENEVFSLVMHLEACLPFFYIIIVC